MPPAKKKVASTTYYDLMGIATDATAEEIRKAYRRKALQLHPDKRGNTPEAQEEFTKMKQAYDVLSDPQKREVYDQVGEDGIKLMEDYGNMSPEEMSVLLFRSLGMFGAKGKCFLITVVTLLFGFFLIIPIFWCLRVDESVSWDWAVVFIPLWILDTLYYCCFGCSLLSSDAAMDPEDKKHQKPAVFKLYKLLKVLMLLVLQIFVAMRLNHDVSWTIIEVFIPYFVYDGLNFIETIGGGVVGYQVLTKESEGAGVSQTEIIKNQRKVLIAAVLKQLVLIASRLVQGVLLALKIDGSLGDASWWLVFIPVWLYVLYFCSHPVKRYFKVRAKQAEEAKHGKKPAASPKEPSHDAYTRESVHEEHEEEDTSKYPLLDVIGVIVVIGVLVSPMFILSARLQDSDFSTFYVLLPWFILVGIAFCFVCCAISCISFQEHDEETAQSADSVRSPPSGDEGAAARTEYVSVDMD